MQRQGERLTYSVVETAQLLGLSRNAAYQGVLAGEIPHLRVGRRILIPRAALEKLLAEAGNKGGDGPS